MASTAMGSAAAAAPVVDESWANSLAWSSVVKSFERLASLVATRGGQKSKLRQNIIFPESVVEQIRAGQSMYPYMRLLLPQLDQERARYQMKEAKIAEEVIMLLGITATNEDAVRLTNYKVPPAARGGRKSSSAASVGDFARVLFDVLSVRLTATNSIKTSTGQQIPKPSDWTVKHVNEWLDDLAAATSKHACFIRLRPLPPLEFMWLVRVILGDMKLGVKQDSVLAWYHPRALACYNSSMSLKAVFSDPSLRDPTSKPEFTVRVGTAFQVMLADKLMLHGDEFAEEKWKQLREWRDMFVEPKLDGERVAMHFSRRPGRSSISMFSRASNNNIAAVEVMRRYLEACIPREAQEVILDGELMAWDVKKARFLPFSDISSTTTHMADTPSEREQHAHLCYCIFDVLFVSGWKSYAGSLASTPLRLRKAILAELIQTERVPPHYVEVVPSEFVADSSAPARYKKVVDAFEKAITRGDEGIMLKDASSVYESGSRSKDWLKVKPEYAEGAFETLDCVVLGGYYGDGTRRSGDVSTFLLGVRDTRSKTSEGKDRYATLLKVGTGYKAGELSDIRRKLTPHWVPVPSRDTRSYVAPAYMPTWRPAKDDLPDVVIDDPANSIVLEIKGCSLTPTVVFAAGYTVRFPRVHMIRNDKDVASVDTLDRVLEMASKNGGSLAKLAVGGAYSAGAGRKERRSAHKKGRMGSALAGSKGGVLPQFEQSHAAVTVTHNLFEGVRFHIRPQVYGTLPNDYNSAPKLQDLVRRLGGTPVATFKAEYDIKYIIADSLELSTRNFIETNPDRDVLKPMWLIECETAGAVVPIQPEYVLHASPRLQEQMDRLVDPYGEYHQRDTGVDALEAVLSAMHVTPAASIAAGAVLPAANPTWHSALTESWDDEDLDALQHRYSLFRHRLPYRLGAPPQRGGTIAYFDRYATVHTTTDAADDELQLSPLLVVELQLVAYGGSSASSLAQAGVNVVVVDKGDLTRLVALRAAAAKHCPRAFIVDSTWVADCLERDAMLPVSNYLIPSDLR